MSRTGSQVTVHRDVVFSSPVGYRPLSLDLYVPQGPVRAACLYLHGGGWRTGSRADGPGRAGSWPPPFFERVAALGLAMASADYRLSGEATFPAQLDDVRAAAAFLRRHGASYGVTAARTVAWGVSAGGHLAALLALAGGDPVDRPAAVACWYPPTDLDALAADCTRAGGRGERGAGARESQLIGAPLNERPGLAKEASPVSHASAGAPPFLLVHGTADTLVPPQQSQRLADALTSAGACAIVDLVPGGSHMFPELDDAATFRLVERTARFLLDPGPGGAG